MYFFIFVGGLLTCVILQEARTCLKNVNNIVSLIQENTEKAVALVWRELEDERNGLRELRHKTMQELQICRGQVESQTVMLKTANEKIDSLQGDLSNSQESHLLHSNENGRLAEDLSKAKEELVEVKCAWKSEVESLRSQALTSQGPLLQAFLYKLMRTNAFGEYINQCGGAINPLAMTDAIELISMDHPNLDINKLEYGYDKDAKEQCSWRLDEEMMRAPSFPLLDALKANDHIISVEVLNSTVNEDLMFRNLDRVSHVCPLGHPMSPPRSDLVVVVPQTLPE